MKLDTIHRVYFLGIGGIGMSALARYFHSMGCQVAGYDLTPSQLTDDLSHLGIDIHFSDEVSRIPKAFLEKADTLIVRTPAVPEGHKELQYFTTNAYSILKRSEVLGILFNANRGMAIAGTHGKTSVSSMAAYIMSSSSLRCTAFLGGILKNIESNLILDPSSEWVVTEADEFDRSFLRLIPEIALVTWVDADHLDIYQSAAAVESAFQEFVSQIKPGGTLILKKGIQLKVAKDQCRLLTYAREDREADYYARDIREEEGRYVFDIVCPDGLISGVKLQVIGKTNIENAVAAAALTDTAGVPAGIIRQALSEFSGVRRRFDIQYQDKDHVYIDDYAHHPRELDAVIGSIRQLYPGRKLTGIFQPHLYSRTRDFADEFAESLSALDELILLDIYPARELPLEGVSSQIIFDRVHSKEKELCKKAELLNRMQQKRLEVLLTLGAGDIDRFVTPLKKMIAKS